MTNPHYDYRDNNIDPAIPPRPNPIPRPAGFTDWFNEYCDALKNGTELPKSKNKWNGEK